MPVEPQTTHHIDQRASEVAAKVSNGGSGDDLLATAEIARLSGLSTQFFEILRSRGLGPRFIRLSPRRVRYLRKDFVAWLEERAHRSTSEYAKSAKVG